MIPLSHPIDKKINARPERVRATRTKGADDPFVLACLECTEVFKNEHFLCVNCIFYTINEQYNSKAWGTHLSVL